MTNSKKEKKEEHSKQNHGSHENKPHAHRPHDLPYYDPDYEHPAHYDHEHPDNPRYPDRRIYGDYASKKPPTYVPHPFENTCFRPRKEDYKPPAFCGDDNDELCIRKDHRMMTTDEQNRFLNAFSQINAMNALGPLVDIHSNAIHLMHGNPRFLPWHRIYLLRMEELLMMVDPTVCIPYWKSSEEQSFPSWLISFTPTVTLMSGPHTVTRNIGMFAILPNAAAVTAALANGTFNTFASALEGIHNSGHVWVSGSMGSVSFAPCDPVFWMHHCEIDRIWAEWQAANPGQNPALAGSTAVMDPWAETEVDTRDIIALGYNYV
ncbi:tyrosinase family protein [Algoriphagus antarcticus]|uniref:Common central domain of tyrosinase n=1 Tax=Algoriphagus antarcticus TaxID=238540 RepID=A0A3E0DHW6_9BACT|nr:tyrosinase family protein [Algoriphagus antarcticus]REG82338.1 common central domain of tyrosinase [Algoriphagus antarcticus]